MQDYNNSKYDCQLTGSIYRIHCNVTDMNYIGQTIQAVRTRINQHKNCKTSFIGQAIQNHGWSRNFYYEILEENIPLEKLNEREIFWIKYYDCVFPKGYNRTSGGRQAVVVSEATRVKLRKPKTPEQKEQISKTLKGRPKSDEHRANISVGRKGIKFTKEHCANISAGKKGKPSWNKGIPCREETKQKLSEINSGEKNPHYGKPAWNRGKPAWNRGILCSDETRAKISATKSKKKK